jgi:transcriptional regulator with XRE-family HTH domain
MQTFGERLKNLRNRKGITQEKLADDLDIPESTIRRLEISDGVPRMSRLKQIADYFGVSTDYLLGKDGNAITNDQARNDAIEEYYRLPLSKQKLVDDLIKALSDD